MATKYYRKKRRNIEQAITGAVVAIAILTFLIQVVLMITDGLGWTK